MSSLLVAGCWLVMQLLLVFSDLRFNYNLILILFSRNFDIYFFVAENM